MPETFKLRRKADPNMFLEQLGDLENKELTFILYLVCSHSNTSRFVLQELVLQEQINSGACT